MYKGVIKRITDLLRNKIVTASRTCYKCFLSAPFQMFVIYQDPYIITNNTVIHH